MMNTPTKTWTRAAVLALTLLGPAAYAQPGRRLQTGFQSPPNAARPRVWWHWMNGNVTKDGITKDLQWMSRVGIGGFQNFDASLFTPLVVPKKLVFMTPEWKEAFRHTTQLAQQLNLEMAIAGSPGWSVTGGPWVKPEDGMKKYVWTETRVRAGGRFAGKLPQPPAVTGPFGQAPMESGLGSAPVENPPTFYRDALVVAYRLPDTDKPFTDFNPKVNSSGGTFTVADLTDGNIARSGYLPPKAVGEDMWIQYEFDTPRTVKAFSVAGANKKPLQEFNGGPENRTFQVSDDGVNFRDVVALPGSIVPLNTLSIPPTTARYFRMAFKTLPPAPNPFAAMMGGKTEPPKPEGVNVAELVLHLADRVHLVEDKAGFNPWKEETVPTAATADAIAPESVIDLTGKMQPDGTLDWTPPVGTADWVVLRLGYSLTGRQNHPASPEATGLEVDKLDKTAVSTYINTYLDMYKDATGGLMGSQGLQYMVLDSYEAGHMTWTHAMPEEFARRRGYSMLPWLPVLTGRVVKSAGASEQFLWDFRKTIGEMITDNHYDVIGEALHKRGLKRYTESHENKRIYLADGMDVKRNADIPMSAMWTPGSLAGGSDEEIRSKADIRESASVAHIYGQNLVAAESMTSVGNAFSFHPEKLKRTADMEMASGLNRFVVHTSVHQPLDDKVPGFSLGPFGQYFTRHETWAEPAKAWVDYLSRSCHLLQQGQPVVDVLYYYGENENITSLFANALPPVPAGYAYDFANATVVQNALRVENGQINVPSGLTYRLLVLDPSARYMTLPVLRKLGELVKSGMKLVGAKPERSPSLSDNPAQFTALANEIWRNPNVSTRPLAEVLQALNIAPDVVVSNARAEVLFVHRKTTEGDVYWLSSRSDAPNTATLSFRVGDRVPELWHPQTGKIEKVSYQIKNGRVVVPLTFDPWDAYFIVFRQKATAPAYTRPVATETAVVRIETPWTVQFQPGRGAPAQATFARLTSWTDHTDAGIKYFSGTGTYENTFELAATDVNARYVLDLGEVKNLAEVIVNGKNMGVAWKKPFRLDISGALKPGKNSVQVKVTNLWVNRLVGDAQPGVTQKVTFTTMPFYRAESPLLPSGLMGPVSVVKLK
ncbi:glycoside hydrolase [Rudanella paleaurantiibacter]|uniref:Glycoside hydrolase n=1 Tax=Rudanella paleaurantiibacter TaxID=2614655 RepID=A0A7J5TRR9_9BACT|nr:glycosyl hydrolase [Rudanella paleaurantiibacter]KAB7725585.1 glycoside hydrolase [Rudanella paleaurantiibacter]